MATATLANTRLSLVDGTAFVDFSASGTLTPFLGHKLTITDSAGKKAIGYIKAEGTGETYGAELITAINNNGYETFTPNANSRDIDSAINTSGSGVIYTNDLTSGSMIGKAYKVVADITLNSGTAPQLNVKRATQSINWLLKSALEDGNYYFTGASVIDDPNGLLLYNASTLSNYSLLWSLKQITAPSATGVTITSTPNGTTYNWASIESGFNYNDSSGYTYNTQTVSSGIYKRRMRLFRKR